MRETVTHLARDGGTRTAILRADFFVRWGEAGEPAAVWINEVEHGFNAACIRGWLGEKLNALLLRAWVLANDEEQRRLFAERPRGDKEAAVPAPAGGAQWTCRPRRRANRS